MDGLAVNHVKNDRRLDEVKSHVKHLPSQTLSTLSFLWQTLSKAHFHHSHLVLLHVKDNTTASLEEKYAG